MKVAYPKHPREILIRVTDRNVVNGLRSPMKTSEVVSLKEKLDEYLVRLGHSTGHVMGIVVRLLTSAKVRVDFRDYTERLELMDAADAISSAQAVCLLEDYLAEAHPSEQPSGKPGQMVTQRIVVQQLDKSRKS